MKEWGTILFTRGSPSKRKFAEVVKINPSTFQNYAHNETSKRTQIGSKLGRNKHNKTEIESAIKRLRLTNQQLQDNATNQPRELPHDHYEWLNPARMIPGELRMIQEEQQHRSDECQRQYYKRMVPRGCNFEHAHRTRAHKDRWQRWWDLELPRICTLMGASDVFLKTEYNLMRKCGRTFGSHEVYYTGPGSYDF